MRTYTYPSIEGIQQLYKHEPEFKVHNEVPYVVVYEDWLNDDECSNLVSSVRHISRYRTRGCGAMTQEISDPMPAAYDKVKVLLQCANEDYFHYDVGATMCAWLQTYGPGGVYPNHWDQIPGQSRKLTALVMLTNEFEYTGGTLYFNIPGKTIGAPRGRGTVFVYPAWLPHEVTAVGSGERQTLNLGVWGPPFR